MASRLGKLLLRAKWELWVICFLSLLFFIWCLAAPWLSFGYYWGNSLTYLMLITAFGLSSFGLKVTWKGWVSTANWVSSGLWWQRHNPLTQYPKHSYSLTLWWSLGLHNTSLNAKFSVQNSSFCWWIKSTS